MAIFATSAWAYDFTSVAPSGQTLYYNIVDGGVELTYPGGYIAPSGNLVIPASVTCSGTTYSVTSIGQNAFSGCSGLTSVTIPDGVTSIGNYAFYGCSGLTVMRMKPFTPPSLGNSYSICGDIIDLVVPHDSYAAYTNAGTNYTRHHIYCDTAFVTVNVNDTLRGQVVGEYDSYYVYSFPPDTITVSPIAYYGYHFARWEDNTTDSIRNITGITHDIVVTAYFDYNQYIITLTPDNAVHGAVNGAGTYNYLSERTISAIANYGYHFTQWSDGDTDNPRTLTLTQDTAFTAMFEPNQYAVTGIPSNAVYGMVSGSDTVDYLDTVILTATPNYGYQFQYWYRDGYYGLTNPIQVVASDNIYYTAYFTPMVYTVGTQSEHGSVYISGSRQYQTQVSLTVSPDYGYHFVQWSDGVTDNPRTFTITQDTAFTAMFEPNQYAVTGVPSDTVYGMVSGSDTVDYLDTVTLTATPNYGYRFQYWYRDGYYGSVQTNPMQVVASGNIYYTAYFTPMVYTVGTQAEHGSIYINGSRQYQTQVSLTVTANYGYRFTQWSDGVTDNPRTFTITQDTSFAALFERNEYTLAFQSADTTKGMVTVVSVPGLYLDTTPYVTAAALPHYHFTQWNDGSTENPRRFVFDGDHTYTASFAIDVHAVGVQVDNLAHGTVSGAGSREYGQPITVSATAYSGYQFTHWSDGSTYNPYTFAVLEDKDLTAIFVADGEPWQDTVVLYDTAYVLLHDTTYLNVMVHDTTYITLTDTVTNTVYDTVTNTVYDTVTNMLYDTVDNFIYDTVTIMQYDTVTNTVYDTVDNYIYDTVTVTDTLWLTRTDTLWLHDTVTVHDTVYVTGEGIDGAEALNAKVYSSHGQVVVEGADGHAVALYDVNGRLLARKEESGERSVFDVTASGTYMIKIGHYPARKVVVVR